MGRRTIRWLLGSAAFVAIVSTASAQELTFLPTRPRSYSTPGDCDVPRIMPWPGGSFSPLPIAPAAPTQDPKKSETAPKETPKSPAQPDAAAQPNAPDLNFQPITASALGDTSFASAAPQMIGDFGGYSIRRTIFVPTTSTTTTTTTTVVGGKTVTVSRTQTGTTLVPVDITTPVAGRVGSGFKIADDASPIPTDRVFFSYNYFDGLRGRGSANAGGATTQTPALDTSIVTASTPIAVPASTMDLHREIFGFEKTFLDGDASFELRLPIFQSTGAGAASVGAGGFAGDNFGDLTAILKFALINEPDRVFSVGLATTLPTGPSVPAPTGNFQAILFQPFVGFLYNFGDFFVQGFSSAVVSTEARDPSLLFNDAGVGYRFYRNPKAPLVTGVSSVLEMHVTTPLENRDPSSLGINVPDIVSFTAGLHLDLGSRSHLSLGCNVPASGPRPYNAEMLVQLNYRF